MSLASEIIALKVGSLELDEIRAAALQGEAEALKKYVLFCALQEMRSQQDLNRRQVLSNFRKMVADNRISVEMVNG
jgi:hypothetical protein